MSFMMIGRSPLGTRICSEQIMVPRSAIIKRYFRATDYDTEGMAPNVKTDGQ